MIESLAAMLAAVAAMMLLGAVSVGGRWLVRALRLPTDLPEGARFEPPPPPAAPSTGAAERAAQRRAIAAVCAEAAAAHRLGLATAEILTANAPELQEASAAIDRAESAIREAEADPATALAAAAAARVQCQGIYDRALAARPAVDQRRERLRLLILLAILVVTVLWLLILLPRLRAPVEALP